MKYYDIEAFKDSKRLAYKGEYTLRLYDYLKIQYSSHDAYFLKNILQNQFDYTRNDDSFFRYVLNEFYDYYKGDPEKWLRHTMNIAISLGDRHADWWLQLELISVETGRMPTQKEALYQYRDMVFKRGKRTQESVFTELAELYNWSSWQSLKNVWRANNKNWRPSKRNP